VTIEQMGMIPGLTPPAAKDASHANRGRWLEDYCDWTHAAYKRDGLARVDRNYPEARRLKSDGFARVTGVALCDYSGVLAGGRAVAFDCKEARTASIALERVKPHQLEHLMDVWRLGGVAFVLVAFRRKGDDRVYAIPADIWSRQAEAAGLYVAFKLCDGEIHKGRLSIAEKDLPSEWRVGLTGRGCDWLATVRRFDHVQA